MLAESFDAHPRVHPWHQPIARRPGEAQFGLAPDAAIITGLTEVELELVRRLDGTRSMIASCREAHDAGVAPARWRELVDLLADLGVLEPAPTGLRGLRPSPTPGDGSSASSASSASWVSSTSSASSASAATAGPGSRPSATVDHADGAGGAGRSIAAHDTASGGAVIVEGTGALADHIARLLGESVNVAHRPGGSRDGADPTDESPALVVLVGSPALDPRAGDFWLATGTAHLPITIAGPRTTVGPLIVGPRGPCLWCLDLHRADRDDAWPTVMAQLCSPGGPGPTQYSHDSTPLAGAAAHLTAGSVTAFAQSVLTGRRPPVGVSLDLWVPWPRIDHRRWEVHPQCAHHRDGPDREGASPADRAARTIAAVA